MQSREGINPMYLNSVIQGLAKEGQLPKGVSASDMKNPDGSFYKTVKENASLLQRQTEGNNGSGGNGTGQTDVALGDIAQMVQGDTSMKVQALNQMLEMSRNSGGGTLTSEEQYEIMNDPGLLEEFGIALQQSLQQQGGGNNSAGNSTPAAAPVPTTAPVVENSGAEADPSSSVAAEESDDPELTSLIEGADETAQSTNESSITFEQNMERIRNLSYEDVQKDLSGPGLEMALGLIDKLKSGEATAKEQQSLEGLLPVPAPKAEKREITIDNLTPGDIRESIPGGPNQTKSLNLLRMVNAGNASDRQVEELMAMLNLDKK
jgi:hypothetical protein